jgi:hypothetical protein
VKTCALWIIMLVCTYYIIYIRRLHLFSNFPAFNYVILSLLSLHLHLLLYIYGENKDRKYSSTLFLMARYSPLSSPFFILTSAVLFIIIWFCMLSRSPLIFLLLTSSFQQFVNAAIFFLFNSTLYLILCM